MQTVYHVFQWIMMSHTWSNESSIQIIPNMHTSFPGSLYTHAQYPNVLEMRYSKKSLIQTRLDKECSYMK